LEGVGVLGEDKSRRASPMTGDLHLQMAITNLIQQPAPAPKQAAIDVHAETVPASS
jgi:hypothetical protein